MKKHAPNDSIFAYDAEISVYSKTGCSYSIITTAGFVLSVFVVIVYYIDSLSFPVTVFFTFITKM